VAALLAAQPWQRPDSQSFDRPHPLL